MRANILRSAAAGAVICIVVAAWSTVASTQPPGPGGPPGGRPPRPDPARMLRHAFVFDADGDGKLSKEEFRKFAEDFASHAPPGGPPGGPPMEAPGEVGHAHPPGTPHVHITVRDGYRYVESNGIPDHETGRFPNRGNPNRIAEQSYLFRIPVEPKMAKTPTFSRLLGVALNGIPFDPGTAELWNGDPNWRYDALSGKINLGIDSSNAHVQPNGAYHYHALPLGLIQKLGKPDEMVLVGYAADGFLIYNQYGHADPKDLQSPLRKLKSSYRLKKGERPGGENGPGGAYDGTFNQDYEYVASSGDLDECNGRFEVTAEYPKGTYHYVITEEFPFVSRLYRGVPDPSFRLGPPPGGGPGGRGGPPGRGPGGFGGPPGGGFPPPPGGPEGPE